MTILRGLDGSNRVGNNVYRKRVGWSRRLCGWFCTKVNRFCVRVPRVGIGFWDHGKKKAGHTRRSSRADFCRDCKNLENCSENKFSTSKPIFTIGIFSSKTGYRHNWPVFLRPRPFSWPTLLGTKPSQFWVISVLSGKQWFWGVWTGRIGEARMCTGSG